jgi:hypothetical protein
MIDLTNVIDLHVHISLDNDPRYREGIDLAQQAAAGGMRAILLKSHFASTANLAKNITQAVPGLLVVGGLALNTAAGGLDPVLVENALASGAKEIWMPTISAANPVSARYYPGAGIGVLDESGKLLSKVLEILDLIHDYDSILGTGHLSMAEIRALVSAARSTGVRRIVITHPESHLVAMPVGIQRELRGPDLFFERCWLNTRANPNHKTASLEQIAAEIREIGCESTILATDLGQKVTPPPVEGMRQFLTSLIHLGFTPGEIDRMAQENPAWLLNLENEK